MKNIVVFGTTSFANTVTFYLENFTDWNLVAYVTDYATPENDSYRGKKLINTAKLLELYPPEDYEIVSGVGYNNMMNGRKVVYEKIKAMGYKMPNFIHPTVVLHNTVLGDGNLIFENTVFEPNATMGSDCILWSAVLVGHNTFVADHNHFAACSLLAGNASMEECCFLGNHSTIRDGIHLAHHTLVGAGAYVSKDTQPYDAIVPARSVLLNHKSTDLI